MLTILVAIILFSINQVILHYSDQFLVQEFVTKLLMTPNPETVILTDFRMVPSPFTG